MRTKIYGREFRISIQYAFPKTGHLLAIARKWGRGYFCTGCHYSDGSPLEITHDSSFFPTTRYARLAVYEHFKRHEQPIADFKAMTDYGRRAWYARKLGVAAPPEGASLDDIKALISLVRNKGA